MALIDWRALFAVAQTLIIAGVEWMRIGHDPQDRRAEPDDDSDEAPETPLDEPRPPRVQDPPPQPDQRARSRHAFSVKNKEAER